MAAVASQAQERSGKLEDQRAILLGYSMTKKYKQRLMEDYREIRRPHGKSYASHYIPQIYPKIIGVQLRTIFL